ncbi:glycine cleavage system protein R [Aquisphaera insulae]|uniref:glycine cleavage system protein R n=1 Tax=Aquisphaera insulae TaxID=2712864 RepID=UPI0013EC761F|nr:ACT domain-containing protein [Aquisphaera insulae]
MPKYIISLTAADRVGIVYSVAGALLDLQGNILELSQTVMRGYFTIILEVEFAAAKPAKLLVDTILERGRRFDPQVLVTEVKEPARKPAVPDGDRFILTILGGDAQGIIHGISGLMAAHGVNITDLHARVDGSRFSMVMEALIPPDLTPGTIRSELERYGREQGIEGYVQHENIFLATTEPGPVRVGVGQAGRSRPLAHAEIPGLDPAHAQDGGNGLASH